MKTLKDALRRLVSPLLSLRGGNRRYAKIGKKWLRTHDIYGHKPAFKITCRFCKSKMVLRYSEVLPNRSRMHGIEEGMNVMEYKCPRCASIRLFNVIEHQDYLYETLDKRGGETLYLPPKEVWEQENEEIKKRLEAIGYF